MLRAKGEGPASRRAQGLTFRQINSDQREEIKNSKWWYDPAKNIFE